MCKLEGKQLEEIKKRGSLWTDFLRKTEKMVQENLLCESFTMYLIDPETNEMILNILPGGNDGSKEIQEVRLPVGVGLAGACAISDQPLLVPDTSNDPRFLKRPDPKSRIE